MPPMMPPLSALSQGLGQYSPLQFLDNLLILLLNCAELESVGYGAGNRIRTYDPRITNALLYQLSYPGAGRRIL